MLLKRLGRSRRVRQSALLYMVKDQVEFTVERFFHLSAEVEFVSFRVGSRVAWVRQVSWASQLKARIGVDLSTEHRDSCTIPVCCLLLGLQWYILRMTGPSWYPHQGYMCPFSVLEVGSRSFGRRSFTEGKPNSKHRTLPYLDLILKGGRER